MVAANNLSGGTKINDVKHQGFTVAILSRQKSCEPVRCAQLRAGKAARNLARGERGNFELDQPADPCFDLLRTVHQDSRNDRHAGGGVAQYVALEDGGDDF